MKKTSAALARWEPWQLALVASLGLLALVLGALVGAQVLTGSGGGEDAGTETTTSTALSTTTTTTPEVEVDVGLGLTGVQLSLTLSNVFSVAPNDPGTLPEATEPNVEWRTALLERANGFAAEATGGGLGGETRWVTSAAGTGPGSLAAALEAPGPAWVCFDRSAFGVDTETVIELFEPLQVPSDITIDGRGSQVTISGKGLNIGRFGDSGERNVIITDIRVLDVQGLDNDSIRITEGSDLIWLTNLEVARSQDGLIDVTRGVSVMRVTVDHTHVHDASKAMLWGTSDPREPTGGNIRGTLHHNVFERTNIRNPGVANAFVHAYNNVVSDWGKTSPDGSVGMEVYHDGELLAEGNVFSPYAVGDPNWAGATVTEPDLEAIKVAVGSAAAGRQAITDRNNLYLGGSENFSPGQPEASFDMPYEVTVEDATEDNADRWRSEAGWTRVEAPADGSC